MILRLRWRGERKATLHTNRRWVAPTCETVARESEKQTSRFEYFRIQFDSKRKLGVGEIIFLTRRYDLIDWLLKNSWFKFYFRKLLWFLPSFRCRKIFASTEACRKHRVLYSISTKLMSLLVKLFLCFVPSKFIDSNYFRKYFFRWISMIDLETSEHTDSAIRNLNAALTTITWARKHRGTSGDDEKSASSVFYIIEPNSLNCQRFIIIKINVNVVIAGQIPLG